MLMVISPAKTLDYNGRNFADFTIPAYLERSQTLIDQLRDLSPEDLGRLMKISPKLAHLNLNRYQTFSVPFDLDNAKQTLLVFKGDVYKGMDLDSYDAEDLNFAQTHLRILSGLYGILRPLDLMQPYRLEMGTKFKNPKGKDLYDFWGSQIAIAINQALETHPDSYLVNLASAEYFKAIAQKALKAKVLNIVFKEQKNSVLKVIALYAKRARGLMVDYAIKHRIQDVEDLKNFSAEGYQYKSNLSTENTWVFGRESVVRLRAPHSTEPVPDFRNSQKSTTIKINN